MSIPSVGTVSGTAEDALVVMTETAERLQVKVATADAAEMTVMKTEESGTTATGKMRTVNTPETERREKQKSARSGKSRGSATASPGEKDLNINEKTYGFAAKAAVVLLRQIVYS